MAYREEYMFKKFKTREIVITGLLLALEFILQILGNYMQVGPANINLSLIPVILAAVLAGPISGAILGFFNGVITFFSPSTIALFMPVSLLGTVITVMLKVTLGGFIAGLAFNLLKKKNQTLALIVASLIVPLVNTGLFIVGSLIFFIPLLESFVGPNYPNIYAVLFFGFIYINFFIEVVTSVVLAPVLGNILLKREQRTA